MSVAYLLCPAQAPYLLGRQQTKQSQVKSSKMLMLVFLQGGSELIVIATGILVCTFFQPWFQAFPSFHPKGGQKKWNHGNKVAQFSSIKVTCLVVKTISKFHHLFYFNNTKQWLHSQCCLTHQFGQSFPRPWNTCKLTKNCKINTYNKKVFLSFSYSAHKLRRHCRKYITHWNNLT